MATTTKQRGYSASDGFTAEINPDCCQFRISDAGGTLVESICLLGNVIGAWQGTVAVVTDTQGQEVLVNAGDPPSGIGLAELFAANCECRARTGTVGGQPSGTLFVPEINSAGDDLGTFGELHIIKDGRDSALEKTTSDNVKFT